MEVEFGWVGWGGGGGVGVQTHFHVKPNSVEISWGCVELGLWQYFTGQNYYFQGFPNENLPQYHLNVTFLLHFYALFKNARFFLLEVDKMKHFQLILPFDLIPPNMPQICFLIMRFYSLP